jgi:glycosyltransferase 2 family protein
LAGKALRIAVAVGLTAVVLYYSHPKDILDAAARADWRWLLAAVGLVFVDRTLMAMRWIDLLVALAPGSRPPLGVVLRVFFVSSFVSNFVPSVASDLYRAYDLSRYNVHMAESTASVLMDRALGVLSVVLVAAAALPFAPAIADRSSMTVTVGLLFALCVVAAAVVFSERAADLVRRTARTIPIALFHRVTDALTDAVRRYADHHGEMLRVLVLSVVVQIIRVLQAWCLGLALGIDVPGSAYFVFVPIIVFIMQVPISVNGIGTAQAAFAWTFVPQGAPAPQVFALSVLFLALGILGTLPGGLLYAFSADQGQTRVRPGSDRGQPPSPQIGSGGPRTRVRPPYEGTRI